MGGTGFKFREFRVWGLGFGLWALGFGLWGLGFAVGFCQFRVSSA